MVGSAGTAAKINTGPSVRRAGGGTGKGETGPGRGGASRCGAAAGGGRRCGAWRGNGTARSDERCGRARVRPRSRLTLRLGTRECAGGAGRRPAEAVPGVRREGRQRGAPWKGPAPPPRFLPCGSLMLSPVRARAAPPPRQHTSGGWGGGALPTDGAVAAVRFPHH